jgi:hypothetical protein
VNSTICFISQQSFFFTSVYIRYTKNGICLFVAVATNKTAQASFCPCRVQADGTGRLVYHVDIFIHSFNDTSRLSTPYNNTGWSLQPAMCGGILHQRHPVQKNKDPCEFENILNQL